mmetsp:Transcript_3048/g.4806  ORF Transcript_3048/g.4806 Transcript_3048/m.4806 type:complete len:364 (+) Transcript_3048:81-1172(+)
MPSARKTSSSRNIHSLIFAPIKIRMGTTCISQLCNLHLLLGILINLVGIRSITINIQSIHHSVNIHILTSKRVLPHGRPVLFHHRLRLLLVVDHHAPLGQVANVQILRPDVRSLIVNDEVLGVHAHIHPVLPLTPALLPNEAHAKVVDHLLPQVAVFGVGVVLPDRFDDLGGNVVAVPPVSVAGLQRREAGGDAARIGEDDLDVDAAFPDGSAECREVVLGPGGSRQWNFCLGDAYRSEVLQSQSEDGLGRVHHGDEGVVGRTGLVGEGSVSTHCDDGDAVFDVILGGPLLDEVGAEDGGVFVGLSSGPLGHDDAGVGHLREVVGQLAPHGAPEGLMVGFDEVPLAVGEAVAVEGAFALEFEG